MVRFSQVESSNICKLFGTGRTINYYFIIMTLLGPSVSNLFQKMKNKKFSKTTSFLLARQMLHGIRDIHNIGYIHRDIKPSNFGIGINCRNIFIFDFGLSREYINKNGKLKPQRPIATFQGTITYASVNAHNKKEIGRHDDLWSLFYILIHFITGKVPI